MSTRLREGFRNASGLLPVLALGAALSATLVLWRALVLQEHLHLERASDLAATTVSDRISSEFESRILPLVRVATRWANQGPPLRAQWEFEAWLNFNQFPAYRAILWADPQFQPQWIETSEVASSNELDAILTAARPTLDLARNRSRTRLSPPIRLPGGATYVVAAIPIVSGASFGGLVVGVFHLRKLLADVLDAGTAPGYSIEIFDGSEQIYSRAETQWHNERWLDRDANLEIYGEVWRLRAWPRVPEPHSRLPMIALIVGPALSGLLALSLYLAQRAGARTAAAEAANRKLEAEIAERERVEVALRESERRFHLMADTAPVMLWISDGEAQCRFFNKPWLDFTGRRMEQELGNGWSDGIHADDAQRWRDTYASAFEQRRSFRLECRLRRFDGEYRWVMNTGVPRFSPSGEFAGFIGSAIDITERRQTEDQIKAALREKEILLREIHHRVKNNLQVISSLLNLQSAYIQDKQALAAYRESQNRIRSMGLIHATLYQSKNLAGIDFDDYVRRLTANLFRSYGISSQLIHLAIDVEGVLLGLDTAIPCGLIINELVSNSLKHAFPEGQEGEIRIAVKRHSDKTYTLIVSDNGVGLPDSYQPQNSETLGLQLVQTLCDQLEGSLELERKGGTCFSLRFCEVEYRERLRAGAA